MITAQRFTSKLTQKGQATIPLFIRNILNINPYESVEFFINEKQEVQLKKRTEHNEIYLCSALAMDEWSSEEDNNAYNDL